MLGEKVSYLKGLMDGLAIDETTKEGKILKVMSEILEEMTSTIEDIADEVDEVVELVDIIDQDLGDVEEEIFDLDDDCCCCYDEDEDEEILNDSASEDDFDDDYDFDDDDEQMYECCCTNCGDTICISESIVKEGSMKCPKCNALLEFNYVEEEEK